ncbi:hypothetical protein JCM19055_4676 [Geomicrobium sp. JCM 19055]|nr:hypothetical protein JCM19055_4676 [Geomicrobium sp. JCM 19055]
MAKVTVKDTSKNKKLTADLNKLGANKIKVGVFGDADSEMVKIAGAHEFGVTITPKSGKYLTIPSHPKAKGKSAGDFHDLFFIPTQKGNGLLAKERGKESFDVYFVLVKSVTIPERSYLRTGFDENIDDIMKKIEVFGDQVIAGGLDTQAFLDMIGTEFKGKIQQHIRKLNAPSNASVTTATKGSSNPLVDEGNLIQSIDFKIE